MSLVGYVLAVIGMVVALALPDRAQSMIGFLLAAMLWTVVGLFYTLHVRMRAASRHPRLQRELTIERPGSGGPGYRDAATPLVLHVDGRRFEAKDLRVVITRWVTTSQTRYRTRVRAHAAVQLVTPDRAWELEQSMTLDDARYAAEKLASALDAEHVEVFHTPYGMERELWIGIAMMVTTGIAVSVVPAQLARASDVAWWTAGGVFIALHLGVYELIRLYRATAADAAADELVARAFEASPVGGEPPAEPERRKRKKRKKKPEPQERAS